MKDIKVTVEPDYGHCEWKILAPSASISSFSTLVVLLESKNRKDRKILTN
jgi:hypothetical protein